jgi:phage shock protein PspC (stress-responsive transcriptional regulator)
MDQRLTRSHTDRMLTGVAGGMAEYFDIDPVIIRLLWVLGALFTGGVLLVAYFVMAIIMPSPPDDEDAYEDEYEDEDLDEEEPAEPADEATDGQEADEADDQGEDAADEEAEPKPDGGATTAAAATSTPSPDAPLAEAPRQRRRAGSRRARRARRRRAAARRRGRGALVFGSILIVIGALALVDQFSLLSFWQFWPLILIGIGGALILGRIR